MQLFILKFVDLFNYESEIIQFINFNIYIFGFHLFNYLLI